jgi:hypothetical protein
MAGIESEAKFDTLLTSITNRGIHALWKKTTGSHRPAGSCLVPYRNGRKALVEGKLFFLSRNRTLVLPVTWTLQWIER